MNNLHGRQVNHKNASDSTGLATASFVLGIIAIVFAFIPIINLIAYVLGVLAVVFGIVGVVKKMGGKATAGLIMGIIALVIAVSVNGQFSNSLNKAVDDLNKTSDQLNKTSDDMSGNNTDKILGKDIDVQLGAFSANADQYGITTTVLPVSVKNLGEDGKSYSIQIEAVDASGNRLADDTVYASNLGKDQSQDLKAFQFV